MGQNKIKSFKEVCKVCHELQKEGKRIVFCHGFFDILHRGHVTLLLEAKKLGDILVVGVDNDDNAKILKGPKRPINDHNSRMFVLANLLPVDFVFLMKVIKQKDDIFGHYNFFYRKLNPDIVLSFRKSGGFDNDKKKQALSIGIKYVDSGELYKHSSSKIIKILGLN